MLASAVSMMATVQTRYDVYLEQAECPKRFQVILYNVSFTESTLWLVGFRCLDDGNCPDTSRIPQTNNPIQYPKRFKVILLNAPFSKLYGLLASGVSMMATVRARHVSHAESKTLLSKTNFTQRVF